MPNSVPLPLRHEYGIVNESRFKDGLQLIIEIMMDDSVAERCREDFPLDRVVDDEADAAARGVCAATDIFIQRDDILRSLRSNFIWDAVLRLLLRAE